MSDDISRKRWDKAQGVTDLLPIEAPKAALDRVDWKNARHCVVFVLSDDDTTQMFQSGKLESYAQLGFAYRALHHLLLDD